MHSSRAGISDSKFAVGIAVFALLFIVLGMGFTATMANQLGTIQSLQRQLAGPNVGALVTNSTSCTLPAPNGFTGQYSVKTGVTRHYTLMMKAADIAMNSNATWHAWTYNGTVPGPTLHAQLGDLVQVHVINNLNLTHSFHMHYVGYNFTDDGSPANLVLNQGVGAMIAPGASYTYNFSALSPGLFFYHDHAADQHPVHYNIAQGLYGTIIVDDCRTPHLDHDWPIMMGEIGAQVSGSNVPYYIMDGKGFVGGEGALDAAFAAGGLPAVQAQINTTLLTFTMKVGQVARLDLINIGDEVHTFHLHDIGMISAEQNPGRMWPAETVPLDPGIAEPVLIQPTQPGLWLFHCHVIGHEDVSMVGAIIVTQ